MCRPLPPCALLFRRRPRCCPAQPWLPLPRSAARQRWRPRSLVAPPAACRRTHDARRRAAPHRARQPRLQRGAAPDRLQRVVTWHRRAAQRHGEDQSARPRHPTAAGCATRRSRRADAQQTRAEVGRRTQAAAAEGLGRSRQGASGRRCGWAAGGRTGRALDWSFDRPSVRLLGLRVALSVKYAQNLLRWTAPTRLAQDGGLCRGDRAARHPPGPPARARRDGAGQRAWRRATCSGARRCRGHGHVCDHAGRGRHRDLRRSARAGGIPAAGRAAAAATAAPDAARRSAGRRRGRGGRARPSRGRWTAAGQRSPCARRAGPAEALLAVAREVTASGQYMPCH